MSGSSRKSKTDSTRQPVPEARSADAVADSHRITDEAICQFLRESPAISPGKDERTKLDQKVPASSASEIRNSDCFRLSTPTGVDAPTRTSSSSGKERKALDPIVVPAGGYQLGPATLLANGKIDIGNNRYLELGSISKSVDGYQFERQDNSHTLTVQSPDGESQTLCYTRRGWIEELIERGRPGPYRKWHRFRLASHFLILATTLLFQAPLILIVWVTAHLYGGQANGRRIDASTAANVLNDRASELQEQVMGGQAWEQPGPSLEDD